MHAVFETALFKMHSLPPILSLYRFSSISQSFFSRRMDTDDLATLAGCGMEGGRAGSEIYPRHNSFCFCYLSVPPECMQQASRGKGDLQGIDGTWEWKK